MTDLSEFAQSAEVEKLRQALQNTSRQLREAKSKNAAIVEAIDEKLFLAARNLPGVEVLPAAAVNPVSLARHQKVLATVGAVKLLEERLQ